MHILKDLAGSWEILQVPAKILEDPAGSLSMKSKKFKVAKSRLLHLVLSFLLFDVDVHGHLANLVAKAPSLCFCQFNGQSGCLVCLHPGERINKGKGNIRVYPYTDEEPRLCTHEQTLLHASTAERTGKPVFGVKGFSPLLRVI